MHQIKGSIGRSLYHKPSSYSQSGNKFLIAQFDHEENGSRKQSIIKGEMNSPVFGWDYILYGEWKETERGPAFAFDSFEPVLPKSHEGMADYLARSVPEIGKVRARQIIDFFGNESFSILRGDHTRIKEVPGIPSNARVAVEEYFASDNATEDPAAYATLYDLLSPVRPPRKVIKQLLSMFGANAPQFITENPYRLLNFPGMGWIRVDRFATEILNYQPDGLERHKQAAIEVMSRNSEYGHTKIPVPVIHCDASNLLGSTLREDALTALIDEGFIIKIDEDYLSEVNLFNAETSIRDEIQRLQSTIKLDFKISHEGLEDEQTLIPDMIVNNSVCIITGVPGSGKSHSVSLIIKSFYENKLTNILVCAPTGKAAKRNDEFLQKSLPGISIPCMTIHRALGVQMETEAEENVPESVARVNRGREQFQFLHDKNNQLPFDVFIIDESSMVDSSLASSFLQAIPTGSRLIIVGDHYQLPSVGPGSFLRDLLDAGIPSVILDKPRRNSGVIAHSCYMIKEGKIPDPSNLKKSFDNISNWKHIETQDDSRILEIIQDIHIKYISQFGKEAAKTNLQVISPEKKGTLGCINLNRVLGRIVNPGESAIPMTSDEEDKEEPVRVHDKIVRNKNGVVKLLVDSDDSDELDTIIFNNKQYYIGECYVVNGDSGEVLGFNNSYVFVKFSNPDRLCALPKSDPKISLSYALTCHKCQGSGFPIVILPLTNYYWNPKLNTGLFCRELLYTSFSRPQEHLFTVGRMEEARKAISRVTVYQRKTILKELFNEHE